MADCRCLIQVQAIPGAVPADYVAHQVHYKSGVGTVSSADYTALADGLKNVFFSTASGTSVWNRYQNFGGSVKVYDLADPEPRPVRGISSYTPTTWFSGALAPRVLSLCLSFYSDRNVPRQRGRLYVGFLPGSEATEKPTSGNMNTVLDLGKKMNVAIGAAAWFHCVRSTVDGILRPVNHYWVNDRWDVVHSRMQREALRVRWP